MSHKFLDGNKKFTVLMETKLRKKRDRPYNKEEALCQIEILRSKLKQIGILTSLMADRIITNSGLNKEESSVLDKIDYLLDLPLDKMNAFIALTRRKEK